MKQAATVLRMPEAMLERRRADILPAHMPERRKGAQAVERALRLLLHLATDDGAGQRLTDLAAGTELDAATARRLLSTLGRHGFVEQDPYNRRYFLGLEFFTLAAAASNRRSLGSNARTILERLTRETQLPAAFFRRAGNDLVCLDLAMPARAGQRCSIELGWRYPIGQGAFGVAVLAAMPDMEGEAVAIANLRRMSRAPEDAARSLHIQLKSTRRLGYALLSDSASGQIELAVAIVDREGRPEGALGVLIDANGTDECVAGCLPFLKAQARAIEQTIWQTGMVAVSSCETRP